MGETGEGFVFPPLPALPLRQRDAGRRIEREPLRYQPEIGSFPNELGVPVGLPELKVTTDRVCVALDTFFVHRDGVHALLRVTHRDPTTGDRLEPHPTFYVHPTDGIWPNQVLWRVGLEFGDGRRAATPSLPDPPWSDGFIFQITGGGGNELLEVHRVYLAPVPPPGSMTLHVDFGDDTQHSATADVAPLVDAQKAAVPIWQAG